MILVRWGLTKIHVARDQEPNLTMCGKKIAQNAEQVRLSEYDSEEACEGCGTEHYVDEERHNVQGLID